MEGVPSSTKARNANVAFCFEGEFVDLIVTTHNSDGKFLHVLAVSICTNSGFPFIEYS